MAGKGIYTKRNDGRKMTEVRPMTAKVGIVPSADGSASFETGKTHYFMQRLYIGCVVLSQV